MFVIKIIRKMIILIDMIEKLNYNESEVII